MKNNESNVLAFTIFFFNVRSIFEKQKILKVSLDEKLSLIPYN